jgi:hypothetical protein
MKESPTERVTTLLEPALLAALERAANENDRSLPVEVRHVLRSQLAGVKAWHRIRRRADRQEIDRSPVACS